MNLYIWPSYKNIETFEPECLTVLTYIKFAQAPVNIFTETKPWSVPKYIFPYLEHSRNQCVGLREIIPYFRKENYGVEYNLTDEELSRLNVLSANIQRDLVPAVECLIWRDEAQYSRVTRCVLGQLLGLPMALVWPPLLRHWVVRRLLGCRPRLKQLEQIAAASDDSNGGADNGVRDNLYESARRCLTSLEYTLQPDAESGLAPRFFVSEKPGYVEAVLYGYLWPLLSLDFEEDPLIVHLRQCTGLIALLQRIHHDFYPHLLGARDIAARPDPDEAEDDVSIQRRLVRKAQYYVRQNWAPIRNGSLFLLTVTAGMVWYVKSHAKA